MSVKHQSVSLTIMGKEYKIACEPDEQDNLIRSASELDSQMCKMRDSGKVGTAERIAVMAALNISHELQSIKNQTPVFSKGWKDSFSRMMGKIEKVLEKH